ncbi:MAG: site-2 protease family protein [Pseudomonadota bacterium]
MPPITQETVQGLLVWYLVFLISTTFHEFAHAFLALKGGDLTAYETGHVTLDPTPHIRRSPWGMVLIPVISYLQLGWMMGYASVPFNADWGRRNPLRQALMSLAGPLANLLLALLAFALMRALLAAHVFEYAADISSGHYVQVVGGGTGRSPLSALALALGVMFKLNVILCVFNLLPLPPLDGAGVLSGLFPSSVGNLYERMNRIPAFSILGIVIAWQVAPYIVSPVWGLLLGLLYR